MKTNFKDLPHQRAYIRNYINRHYIGEKKCANCSSTENLSIVHNEQDPYNISFICKDCRTKLNKEQLANLPKTNILKHVEVNKRFSHSKDLVLTKELKFILEQALKTEKPLVQYLKEHKISYNKYQAAIKKYEEQEKPIRKRLKEHFNYLRAENISKSIKSTKNKTSE